jgi:membrane-associated HD superfamily phosphohydrolase
MELFLPSLFILLLSAVLVLGVVPRISPLIIFIITLTFLVVAGWAHYQMFHYEYQTMAWRDYLTNSAPIVIGVILTVGILIAFLNIFTNVKITMPKISFFESEPESIIKGYSNIPIEKIIELEKQL